MGLGLVELRIAHDMVLGSGLCSASGMLRIRIAIGDGGSGGGVFIEGYESYISEAPGPNYCCFKVEVSVCDSPFWIHTYMIPHARSIIYSISGAHNPIRQASYSGCFDIPLNTGINLNIMLFTYSHRRTLESNARHIDHERAYYLI